MKINIVIPAKLNSVRLPKKNLRLLNGKPLISYMIETCKKVIPSKDIYLYSSSDIFEKIAKEYGIQFYRENEELSKPDVLIDDAIYDIISNLKCDYVIQANPTAPFITEKNLKDFITILNYNKYDVVTSVKPIQIECIFNNSPVNFNPNGKMMPSQKLKPVFADCASLYGFRTLDAIYNYISHGHFIYGTSDNKNAYYILRGNQTIDIDTEEDFKLAEYIIKSKDYKIVPKYYDDSA